jgi:hypothetical protein
VRREKKLQIGLRVAREVHEAIERLAAVAGCSLSHYSESVLTDHIARQQHPDAGGGVWQEVLHELDGRFAKHAQHAEITSSRELTAAVLQLQKEFNSLRAMLDALARILVPKEFDLYVKTVKATLQQMTMNGTVRP